MEDRGVIVDIAHLHDAEELIDLLESNGIQVTVASEYRRKLVDIGMYHCPYIPVGFGEDMPFKVGNFKTNEPYYRQYEKKGGKKW